MQQISRGKTLDVSQHKHWSLQNGAFGDEDFVFTCRLVPALVTPQIQFVYLASLLSLLPFFQATPRGGTLGSNYSFGITCLENGLAEKTSLQLTVNVVVMHGTHVFSDRGATTYEFNH